MSDTGFDLPRLEHKPKIQVSYFQVIITEHFIQQHHTQQNHQQLSYKVANWSNKNVQGEFRLYTILCNDNL